MNAIFTKSSQPKESIIELKFKQLGGMMIESLVGLLILSVIGGGVMHATARMTNTQQQQAINNIAVNQMRSILMNRATAANGDICTGDHDLNIPGKADNDVRLTVNGCSNATFTITNVRAAGGSINVSPITSMRPIVLEVGSDNNKIRVGGTEVRNVPTP